jgi:hypothetical protein
MDQVQIIRLASMAAAVMVVAIGGSVAKAAKEERGKIATVGILIVACLIVYVGFILAKTSIYRGY